MHADHNFKIKKSAQSEYGNYSMGSKFIPKVTAIDDDILETLELINLETLLPRNPGYEFVRGKLEAHLNGSDDSDDGDSDDGDSDSDSSDDDTPSTKQESKAASKSSSAKSSKEESSDDEENVNDILAQIRKNRGAAK